MTRARDKANSTVTNFASTGIDDNADATAITIDSSENVGIGTTSPDETAQIFQTANVGNDYNEGTLKVGGSTTALGFQMGYHSISSGRNVITSLNNGGGANQRISIGFGAVNSSGEPATNVMTLAQDGNVHVGKTTTGIANAGLSLRGDADVAQFTRSGDATLELNRLSSNGDITIFYKDSSNVGSIGTNENTDLFIAGGDTGFLFNNDSDFISACTATGAGRDNAVDLGASNVRFDDIFATNGTIQTSDQNEKQNIASLTSAEIIAAKSISALFKTFKWKDKVASKGNAARTHTGVIAQEVQTAMSNAGLDATDYAFWCSDTWWEASIDVPAVEASEEVLDKFGTVTTEAVEAKDAYTRTDTYETADEAPDGATQITRMGIRYPELLAFVGAATEQRLANIETRLTALEAE